MSLSKKGNTGLNAEILSKLNKFKHESELKQTALSILVKMVEAKEVEELQDQFGKLDKEKTGFVEGHELKKALLRQGLSPTEVAQVIQELDCEELKRLNYS